MNNLKRLMRKRGSALLVVLGFLAFLMVSGVAFSVLMRVERTATSNYKHSVAARHLLQAGLFRAMDEIDSELRINLDVMPAEDSLYHKFPQWEGRVKVSPIITDTVKDEEFIRENHQAVARPLSLEALSFIPPILVNDVRYHSVFASANTGNVANVRSGAKWRRLGMPIENKVNVGTGTGTNAKGKSFVGRYAYVCINLSDMLNVNGVTALGRSSSNRVSIAHLFQNDSKREAFERQRKEDDGGYYATVQDFYAALDETKMNFFSDGVGDRPYFDFIRNNNPQGLNTAFNHATNHVLVTDGFAKPYANGVCNIAETPPFLIEEFAKNVTTWRDEGVPLMQAEFKEALSRCFTETSEKRTVEIGDAFSAMLIDYLAPNDLPPKRLNVPSNKRCPMIAGIQVNDVMTPVILQVPTLPVPPSATPGTEYKIQLIGGNMVGFSIDEILRRFNMAGSSASPFQVKLCWPFRHDSFADDEFSLELDGWITVGQKECNTQSSDLHSRRVFFESIGDSGSTEIKIPGHASGGNQDSCYLPLVSVPIQFKNASALVIPLVKKDGAADARWEPLDSDEKLRNMGGETTLDERLMTDVVVRVRVKHKNGQVFDCVPQGSMPYWGAVAPDREIQTTPHIFFQSERGFHLTDATPSGEFIPFEWVALEVPDPRFNHNPDNWFVPEGGVLTLGVSDVANEIMGTDGRDNGIFMATSGAGVMQSPGELGFIIRPDDFQMGSGGTGADFRGRTKLNHDSVANNKDFFFRTIRLYDHGDPGLGGYDKNRTADRIFENFEDFDDTASASRQVRVNPLSDLPSVLSAAIDRVPYDYRVAWQNRDDSVMALGNPNRHFQSYLSPTDWQNFSTNWVAHVMDVVDEGKVNQLIKNRRIADVYGKWSITNLGSSVVWNSRRWHTDRGTPPTATSEDAAMRIAFRQGNADIMLSQPLYEADRKMLYSFSMDAFSDRQQLFLYVLQAEATGPGVGGGARSLAGGRAVALVWRDPYPRNVTTSPFEAASMQTPSPWGWRTGVGLRWEPAFSKRSNGYHEQKILYFKQLDN